MSEISSLSIILKKSSYNDSDKIVLLLSSDLGKISAIAKYAKKSIKRNLNLLDVGYILRVHLHVSKNSELLFIKNVEFIEKLNHNDDHNTFYILTYLNELISCVIQPKQDSRLLFKILTDFFISIKGRRKDKRVKILILFQIKFLELVGYKINLSECSNCGKDGDFYKYSLEKSGIVCNNCIDASAIQICKGTKKLITTIDRINFKNTTFSEYIQKELEIISFNNIRKLTTEAVFNKMNNCYNVLKNGI